MNEWSTHSIIAEYHRIPFTIAMVNINLVGKSERKLGVNGITLKRIFIGMTYLTKHFIETEFRV